MNRPPSAVNQTTKQPILHRTPKANNQTTKQPILHRTPKANNLGQKATLGKQTTLRERQRRTTLPKRPR
ncbi:MULTISPECIES: hypothetical protein [Moorena]|uniref:hypothetical protein n=1 Tax=Moorena TaxID=1155738 RepID=UPI000307AAD4|nr:MULTISPECIES: hypothetical protein [Moorena]NEQ13908.1 hypothetical protein [Moorena sp. SIO3E2]NES83123.1 hypothetical protein [Moorena sp. SIO2B7]NEP33725.1 hypothetical protein [Moorena sp. SIO3B2]NEP65747.1 hypothetical protein [Moorena sp. SIO3A5]NEQ08013.1 hypothetical protein [Moorena sp. SIO4E2]